MTTSTDGALSSFRKGLRLFTPRTSRISGDQSMPSTEFSYYSMQHKRRGTALIFNIKKFKNREIPRIGTDEDKKGLELCLRKLGFDVVVKENSTADQIKKEITSAAQKDRSDDDCFLCIFLTHGDDGVIHGSDSIPSVADTLVKLQEDVFDQFRGENCKTLIGKPKIFIIQACRGDKYESGVFDADSVQVDSGKLRRQFEKGTEPTIPSGADFLICYSTSQGFYSFRDKDGSWYVSALCEELERYGTKEEFTKILTEVHHKVSRMSLTSEDPSAGKKQMPCFVSMLTKQLQFSSR